MVIEQYLDTVTNRFLANFQIPFFVSVIQLIAKLIFIGKMSLLSALMLTNISFESGAWPQIKYCQMGVPPQVLLTRRVFEA